LWIKGKRKIGEFENNRFIKVIEAETYLVAPFAMRFEHSRMKAASVLGFGLNSENQIRCKNYGHLPEN
jgi:hypothetical protein